VYLGLQRFSARAEAANFTPDAAGALIAHAHALTPRRRVFVTVNTLVQEHELSDALELLSLIAELDADAAIVQDLGVARLARRWVPRLELHASTQMAIHNLEGARAAAALGFRRITLARELTLDEIRDICRGTDAEIEVFAHGALCYSYSGLCLFSSHLCGRSGNRGRCAYPCRDRYQVVNADGTPVAPARAGFPFSMKDLALPAAVPELAAAGVACLKLEGRMKSPLYVAAATHCYRRLLDGGLDAADEQGLFADIRTVFSRPWTSLYLNSRASRDVVDADMVGHRGVPAGTAVDARTVRGQTLLRIRLERALERHDGLQFERPGEGRPLGFPVQELRLDGRSVFAAPAGARVEVALPANLPAPPAGTTVFCASSQALKRAYTWPPPPPLGAPGPAPGAAVPLTIEVTVGLEQVYARATLPAEPGGPPDAAPEQVEAILPGPFAPARVPGATAAAVRTAFSRLGHTSFTLGSLEVRETAPAFVPASRLNPLRRELTERAAQVVLNRRAAARAALRHALAPAAAAPVPAAPHARARWSLKVRTPEWLSAFAAADWEDAEEIVCPVDEAPLPELLAALARSAQPDANVPPLRFALPIILRAWERRALAETVRALLAAGARRWEAGSLFALPFLAEAGRELPTAAPLDLQVDWGVPILNHAAAQAVCDLGAHGFTVSPEDTGENLRALLPRHAEAAVVPVYQDTPLFISETCPRAALEGCARSDPGGCQAQDWHLRSDRGGLYRVETRGCRAVVTDRRPFCLARRLGDLRAAGAFRFRVDLAWGRYTPQTASALWRQLRSGQAPAGTHEGNYGRAI
jgi:putative protease